MHDAPSVTYPVGRCRFPLLAAGVLWLAGIVVSAAWLIQSRHPAWVAFAACALLLIGGASACIEWMSSPEGQLTWDRQSWRWLKKARAGAEPIEVAPELV